MSDSIKDIAKFIKQLIRTDSDVLLKKEILKQQRENIDSKVDSKEKEDFDGFFVIKQKDDKSIVEKQQSTGNSIIINNYYFGECIMGDKYNTKVEGSEKVQIAINTDGDVDQSISIKNSGIDEKKLFGLIEDLKKEINLLVDESVEEAGQIKDDKNLEGFWGFLNADIPLEQLKKWILYIYDTFKDTNKYAVLGIITKLKDVIPF